MQNYCNNVKNKLNMLISRMEKNVSDFVVDPKRDFVRKSELSFSKTMRFILGMGSQTLSKELMDFYGFDPKMVSVSAVVQRRSKILPADFEHLFHEFNEAFSQTSFFRRYRLYAADGSDIHIPTIPDDKGTFYRANDDAKGYNLMHLNALYDLLDRRYADAVLQDSRNENEHSALISMAENIGHETIIVADRGYESYNTIANLENNGLKYVIRIKTKAGIAQKFDIPANEEADFTADILLTRRHTNEVKSNPDKYRFLNSQIAFDFLPKGSKGLYPLKFRIIRIKISENNYETIVTNLWNDEFSADDIKKIYKLRWGIETSFRELKYHLGLIAFHSKKKDCIIQEIFARLIMYNFSMLITANILIDDDMHNDYRYKINYAFAIHICIAFFRCNNVSPSHLEKLIARNNRPSDLIVKLSEKLVTILLYLSLIDYHNSFLVSILFQADLWSAFLRKVIAEVYPLFPSLLLLPLRYLIRLMALRIIGGITKKVKCAINGAYISTKNRTIKSSKWYIYLEFCFMLDMNAE